MCKVTGTSYAGGLIAYNHRKAYSSDTANTYVEFSYACGKVYGSGKKGGLIGAMDASGNGANNITSSYYDTSISEMSDMDRGTPLDSNAMKLQASYVGWDYDTIWAINAAQNGGYPYDSSVLRLVSARNGEVITGGSFTTSQSLNVNPFVVMWNDSLASQNYTTDGDLVVLTFAIAETAEVGETQITVSYEYSATFNSDLEFVSLTTENGLLKIANRIIGDADGDGKMTLRDVAVMRRYLAGWEGYTINTLNADVNGDGVVTLKDVVLIERFLADWDVTLI